MATVLLQRLGRLYGEPLEWLRVAVGCLTTRFFGAAEGGGQRGLRVSVVIPVRNRKGLRLENTLRTLLRQSMPHDRYEIIVVDYGGTDGLAEWLREIDANIRCIRSEEKGVFNEARAKNIGIRAAQGEFVCCTNGDILFAEGFLETVCVAADAPHQVLVECNRYNLEKEDVDRLGLWLPDEWQELIKRKKAWLTTWARGDCQAARKSVFVELGGYDEDFTGWGYLDTDWERRCRQAGCRLAMVNSFTAIAHQGHDSQAGNTGSNARLAREKEAARPTRNRHREWGMP